MSDSDDDPPTPPEEIRIRVRGIYTTALTELFHENGEPTTRVVRASEPIRERFDPTFAVEPADVSVETTAERQGVGVVGGTDAVPAVADRLAGVGRDSFVWTADAPAGAVFQGVVTDTLGPGAVLDLGPTDGFLPYDNAADYVDEGDALRVQVTDPEPPWSDDRPVLDTDLVADGDLVTLRYTGADGGDGGSNARTGGLGGASEAERLAGMLPTEVPEGWTPRWDRAADDADMEHLDAALSRAVERAETIMTAVADADPDEAPGAVATPLATTWVWFGRECRFGLDDHRAAVTTTMPGHHRTKAADYAASAAVDFAEAVCEPSGEFPFAAVTRQFGPTEGDRLALHHGKPDGRLITLGRGEVTDYDPAGEVTVRREMSPGGTYDALGVERRAGDVAITKLKEGRWWYPTVYRGEDGSRRGTYVNVCTPVEIFPEGARYVDLHVDVVKDRDGAVRRVDDDELDAAVEAGNVNEALAERARDVARAVENAL